ncbi:MAG: YraN family protein, partial [Syntrophomonadaceae bacterium]|nr:YraN family protein [Syntrophomonadaceae bacterium]
MKGETYAAEYLLRKGYKILCRNYRTRYGEIDIICEKQRVIIFVEVKTRTSIKYGYPEEAITRKKMEHIKKVAMIYLHSCDSAYKEIRFDVITILLNDKEKTINHIEKAF